MALSILVDLAFVSLFHPLFSNLTSSPVELVIFCYQITVWLLNYYYSESAIFSMHAWLQNKTTNLLKPRNKKTTFEV